MCLSIYWCIFTALSSSCSVNEFDTAADNAFITCMTNVSCEAGCYRGYIFPNGQTNESYICQDGFWTPVILTCKRNYLGFLLHILSQNQSPFKIRLILSILSNLPRSKPTVHWLIKTSSQIICTVGLVFKVVDSKIDLTVNLAIFNMMWDTCQHSCG